MDYIKTFNYENRPQQLNNELFKDIFDPSDIENKIMVNLLQNLGIALMSYRLTKLYYFKSLGDIATTKQINKDTLENINKLHKLEAVQLFLNLHNCKFCITFVDEAYTNGKNINLLKLSELMFKSFVQQNDFSEKIQTNIDKMSNLFELLVTNSNCSENNQNSIDLFNLIQKEKSDQVETKQKEQTEYSDYNTSGIELHNDIILKLHEYIKHINKHGDSSCLPTAQKEFIGAYNFLRNLKLDLNKKFECLQLSKIYLDYYLNIHDNMKTCYHYVLIDAMKNNKINSKCLELSNLEMSNIFLTLYLNEINKVKFGSDDFLSTFIMAQFYLNLHILEINVSSDYRKNQYYLLFSKFYLDSYLGEFKNIDDYLPYEVKVRKSDLSSSPMIVNMQYHLLGEEFTNIDSTKINLHHVLDNRRYWSYQTKLKCESNTPYYDSYLQFCNAVGMSPPPEPESVDDFELYKIEKKYAMASNISQSDYTNKKNACQTSNNYAFKLNLLICATLFFIFN